MQSLLVDGRWYGQHGIGRYASETISRLGSHSETLSRRVRPASLTDPLWLRAQQFASRADVFFSPGYNCALASSIPQLLVIHDLIHLGVPAESSRQKRLYYNSIVKPAILKAGVVVTVSEFSRRKIVEWTGLRESDVVIAPNGLSNVFLTVSEASSACSRPYILYVGNAKPHKNLSLLFAAMSILAQFNLVLVGSALSSDAETGLSARTRTFSSVSEVDLAALYAGAACVALPSIYEGFGMAAIEALSQGTPVAYMCDAVADVVGDQFGVRSAHACSPSEYAAALCDAADMKTPGFLVDATRHARQFAWEETAQILGRTIESVR